ncbi:MAG: peptidoglycan-binding protein [Pseudorhodoplanes sp.]|uniref:peptidoglycan-binding domain-containing protein n=1 Tax=Pseudorhodoplanes sp. TaxID=1934341 RepID=UPI003D0A2177
MHTLSTLVSDDTLNRIVQIESGGDPDAKAATSSATGLGQFLNATWLACVRRHEPELMAGRNRAQVLALRKAPAIALRMLARHTEDNLGVMGRAAADGDLYLAHFLGAGTARALLRAAPQTPVAQVVRPAAIKANRSILSGRTCGQVRAWAARKMAAPPARDWIALYARPAIAAVPDPRPDPRLDMIQRRLKALGYHEVGFVDGRPGSRMAAAIAAFKVDRGLQGDPVADAALVAAIDAAEAEGFVRPIAAARKGVTERRVAAEVAPVAESRWSRFLAKLGIGGAGGAIGFEWISEKVEGVRELAEPVLRIAAKMPWQLWVAGFAIVLLLIWKSQRKAVTEGVRLVRDGRLMS